MATFVLVHGAMHGGWCWRDVRDELVARGHAVHTPTLTGQGDRRHLLSPAVGIDTHVEDLTSLFFYEDLDGVTLVLHSYAGVLAGPVADRLAERLEAVVYLGAFLARPGECLLDVEPPETADRYRRLVAESGDGWRLPATDAFVRQFGVTDPALASWVGARLTDFPFRCQTDPVSFDPERLSALRQVYVRHTDPPLPSLEGSFARAVAAGWDTRDLACGHDMMLVAPGQTADLLEDVARTR